MTPDPQIEALTDHADRYICPACGKGIDEDECMVEHLYRTGKITLEHFIQQSKDSAQQGKK